MKGTRKQERVIWKKGAVAGKKESSLSPVSPHFIFCVHGFSTSQTQLSQNLEQASTKFFLESAVSEEGAGMGGGGGGWEWGLRGGW